MARARSYDVIEYRKIIMNKIFANEKIVELFGVDYEEAADELSYHYVFPHEFIPDTVTKTDRFLNFELAANIDPRNNTYKNVAIHFFVFCHNDVIVTDYGLWYDRIVCELDNIFGEENVLGVGKTSIVSNLPYKPNNNFTGRVITFTVKEFTDGLKNGK